MRKAGSRGPAAIRVSLLFILVVMAFVPRSLAGVARQDDASPPRRTPEDTRDRRVPADGETLLGATWQDSLLVSFDPSPARSSRRIGLWTRTSPIPGSPTIARTTASMRCLRMPAAWTSSTRTPWRRSKGSSIRHRPRGSPADPRP